MKHKAPTRTTQDRADCGKFILRKQKHLANSTPSNGFAVMR